MKVCIAEKPSVARDIAKVLGAHQKKEGYYQGAHYQVTWSIGHLCQLKEPADYQPQWKSWNLNSLPIAPERFELKLLPGQGQKKQFNIIKRLFQSADEIINCGDAGQEGEVIQRWILELTQVRKPVKRLWISSLTEEAIQEGFANLKDSRDFDLLYAAGRSRSIGDWLLGMNATRLFTKKYGKYKEGVLSVGRVQTPTLAMVVERHQAIQNFKPETYWDLRTKYRDVVFRYERGKIQKASEGQALLESIAQQLFSIQSIETKKGKEPPPLLYDLTTIQMEGNRKYGMSADSTLKTLQALYEKKLISYPRVDTRYLSQDLYAKIPAILQGITSIIECASPLLERPIKRTSRVFNDLKVTDHHALIPTGKIPGSLYPHEHKLYDLIIKRFVAVFYPDCLFSQTTVNAVCETHPFQATGKQILDPGWQEVYGKELVEQPDDNKKESADEAEQRLPEFTKGESGPHAPELEKKMTRPPRPHTEATLLRAMETAGKTVEDEELQQLMKANGIGRPATRAAIIETLLKRHYLERHKKQLQPTQKGIDLIQTIQNPTLKSAELTGLWEKQLREIESGERKEEAFLKDMQNYILQLIHEVQHGSSQAPLPSGRQITSGSLGICPKCQKGQVIEGHHAWGCSNWKESDGACPFRMGFTWGGKQISSSDATLLIQGNPTALIKGLVNQHGQRFNGRLHLNANHEIEVFTVLK